MKKYLILGLFFVSVLITGFFIVVHNSNKNLSNIYDFLVYIEAYNDDTISNGSGFVFKIKNNKNYIITSYHVVQGYDEIEVYNTNLDKEEAVLLDYDIEADIAILAINDNLNLENANISYKNVNLGDTVFIGGTPLNKNYVSTLSSGIVSFVNRKILIDNKTYNTIQLDININPGNSGGPLLDINGNVIGIIFLKEENAQGLAFALPASYFEDLIKNY